jgi:hypothetical protein
MRSTTLVIGLAAAVLLATGHDSLAQRGGRVGGGAVGGARGGGIAVGPAGGVGVGTRAGGTVVGPAGGFRSVEGGSGSYTTQRGTTIEAAGIGRGGTTPGGISTGRGVGGVQVTTPGGREVTKVGTAGGVSGPAGNGTARTSGVTVGSGPGGSFGSAYHGGVTVGPHGAAVGGSRVGTATGVGGTTVSGGSRGGAAVGPYGAAAAGTRGGVAVGTSGTVYRSSFALATTGGTVRSNFRTFAQQYPVLTARWVGPTWRPVTWAALSTYGSYPAEPTYINYGETVVYSGDTVVINGETEIPAEQYAQQATDIATTGKDAKADPKTGEWQPLGVFAMIGEGETKATNIFQLSINKEGVIRGEYYNALTDTAEPVYGSADKKTQRAAWTVADRKAPVYEVGIANLTKPETTMLVHFAKDKSQQFTLIRLEKPEGEAKGDK